MVPRLLGNMVKDLENTIWTKRSVQRAAFGQTG